MELRLYRSKSNQPARSHHSTTSLPLGTGIHKRSPSKKSPSHQLSWGLSTSGGSSRAAKKQRKRRQSGGSALVCTYAERSSGSNNTHSLSILLVKSDYLLAFLDAMFPARARPRDPTSAVDVVVRICDENRTSSTPARAQAPVPQNFHWGHCWITRLFWASSCVQLLELKRVA